MQRTSMVTRVCATALLLVVAAAGAPASTFVLPDDSTSVVGEMQSMTARSDETLLDIARRFSVGYEEIRLANPDVDPWLPGEGARVVLPTRYVLPDTPRRGIVLNLAEMRLYYFPRPRRGEQPTVVTYPVSIGRRDWQTPLGRTTIAAKAEDPAWYPPESIRAEHAAKGDPLPRVVPPGPDNPLGRHALRLGLPGYLIHGTNKPFGIGMRVSHGCVRMHPDDIKAIFDRVPVGAPVHIINQPVKAGWIDDVLYVEVHPAFKDAQGTLHAEPTDSVRRVVAVTSSEQIKRVDWKRLDAAVQNPRGIPVAASRPGARPGAPTVTTAAGSKRARVGTTLRFERTLRSRAKRR